MFIDIEQVPQTNIAEYIKSTVHAMNVVRAIKGKHTEEPKFKLGPCVSMCRRFGLNAKGNTVVVLYLSAFIYKRTLTHRPIDRFT